MNLFAPCARRLESAADCSRPLLSNAKVCLDRSRRLMCRARVSGIKGAGTEQEHLSTPATGLQGGRAGGPAQPERRARSGADSQQLRANGPTRYCFTDAAGRESPNLRVSPGDLVVLHLKNALRDLARQAAAPARPLAYARSKRSAKSMHQRHHEPCFYQPSLSRADDSPGLPSGRGHEDLSAARRRHSSIAFAFRTTSRRASIGITRISTASASNRFSAAPPAR